MTKVLPDVRRHRRRLPRQHRAARRRDRALDAGRRRRAGLAAELPVGAARLPRRLHAGAARWRRSTCGSACPACCSAIPPAVPHLLLLRHLREAGPGAGHLRRRARLLPRGAGRVRGAARRAARGPAQGGGRDRARAPHPDRPPPRHDPRGRRARARRSASSSSARWAATTTTTSPSATGASASSAATSWARGSPRRSSWRWRARCCTTPSPRASAPATCWPRSTTGSRATSRASACPTSSPWPSPCTTPPTAAWSSPAAATTRCSSPARDGLREVPSRGAALGVRTGLQFPEDTLVLEAGATVALYTDGLTEARDPERRRCSAWSAWSARSSAVRTHPFVTHWRVCGATSSRSAATRLPSDDATLLLVAPRLRRATRRTATDGSQRRWPTRRAAAPASLQVYRYRAGDGPRRGRHRRRSSPTSRRRTSSPTRSEALARETFMCYAVSQRDDFVADELCFVPQGDRCDILSIRTNGWQRHHGDHRRSLVEILNNLAARRRLRQAPHPRRGRDSRARSAGDAPVVAFEIGDTAALQRAREAVRRGPRRRPASTTSTASGPSSASRRP